ncbi:MAG: hypothetical protein JWO07_125 [Candidatus Saccharibacteria bacterium]|nr:hypothetical protein [Candidatus Saccharibacteria bacterium]
MPNVHSNKDYGRLARQSPPTATRITLIDADNGIDCRLPVLSGYPVPLNPCTLHRAADGLVIMCRLCGTYWTSTHTQLGEHPDTIWVETPPTHVVPGKWWWQRSQTVQVVADQTFDYRTFYNADLPFDVDHTRDPNYYPPD